MGTQTRTKKTPAKTRQTYIEQKNQLLSEKRASEVSLLINTTAAT